MDDMDALKAELEHYREQKDKIRDIVGQIGGQMGRKRQSIINTTFLVLVVGMFVFDLLRHFFGWEIPYLTPLLLIEIAVLLVSLKIIWMIHNQTKVDHFQFWILHSIEFQMAMFTRRITELSEELKTLQTLSRQTAQQTPPTDPDDKPAPAE